MKILRKIIQYKFFIMGAKMKNIILNTIQFIKKHDNIFCMVLIVSSIYGITLCAKMENTDELWNFQNVYKLYNGFQIYQDANVIVTPLFFWIGKILFIILGANLFVFRIYNIIIMTLLYFFAYLLLKNMDLDKKIAIIIVLIFIILYGYCLLLVQANYNTMALMLCLLGVLLFMNKNKEHAIIQGVILFLIFSTKQNIGIFYAIGLFFSEVLTGDNKKEKIKNIIVENTLFLTFLIILLMYFYDTNILYNFIDYAVWGIKEFAEKNTYIDVCNAILSIFFVSINLILTIVFIKNKRVDTIQKRKLMILNCFSIPLIFIMIPILNQPHFVKGIYLSLILFVSLNNILFKEMNFRIRNDWIVALLVLFSVFMCSISTYYFIGWIETIQDENYRFDKEEPFYGGIYSQELITNIDNIIEYIESNPNRVIVLSTKASFYMIPTKKSNGMMDLPLKGNLGKEGERGLIEQIKNMTHTEILIERDEEQMLYQESKMVREYIIENMTKKGEIEEFEIYEKTDTF